MARVGITADFVGLGATETDFGGEVMGDNPPINQYITSNTALGCVSLPNDISGGDISQYQPSHGIAVE